ncbi:nuclease-related domain-containing protein [Lysinibacillus sp. NPDC094177]|uniref:nuclease-related domain-containing protein n=1 Tax=Lysinibacillus sp. NPDC094177 TaxID=3390580 RepID=UPI003CFFA298
MNSAQHSHQLDTLFICSNFMLVIEIKNINGRLDFDDITHQCIRTKPDGTVEGFPNAITQTQRHMQFLKVIYQNYSLPIEGAVIISNPSTIIASHPNTIPIFHVSGLQTHLHSLFEKYTQAILSDAQLTQIAQQFLSRHQPSKLPASIDSSRFRRGVLCPKCQYKSQMHYSRGIWICSYCQYASEEIFAEALQDYRYLVRPTITNKQLREFFDIPSSDAANRLLRNIHFTFAGIFLASGYLLPLRGYFSRARVFTPSLRVFPSCRGYSLPLRGYFPLAAGIHSPLHRYIPPFTRIRNKKKECSIGWKHSFLYYRVTFSSTTFSLTTPLAFGTLL